jgi:hypothetical protein
MLSSKVNGLLFATSLLPLLAQAGAFCTPKNEFCMTTTPNPNTKTMGFSFKTNIKGWISIGFGKSMSAADFLILYNTPTTSVVSSRYSNGNQQPVKNKDLILQRYNASNPAPTSNFQFVFNRPYEGDGKTVVTLKDERISLIWAYSNKAVGEDGNLEIHADKGTATVNLFSSDAIRRAQGVWALFGIIGITLMAIL